MACEFLNEGGILDMFSVLLFLIAICGLFVVNCWGKYLVLSATIVGEGSPLPNVTCAIHNTKSTQAI